MVEKIAETTCFLFSLWIFWPLFRLKVVNLHFTIRTIQSFRRTRIHTYPLSLFFISLLKTHFPFSICVSLFNNPSFLFSRSLCLFACLICLFISQFLSLSSFIFFASLFCNPSSFLSHHFSSFSSMFSSLLASAFIPVENIKEVKQKYS